MSPLNVLGPRILGFLLLFGLVLLTIRACAADAIRRGKPPLLVTIAVVFSFRLPLLCGSSFDQSLWTAAVLIAVST